MVDQLETGEEMTMSTGTPANAAADGLGLRLKLAAGLLALAAALAAAALAGPPQAHAAAVIQNWSAEVSSAQAGGHPDVGMHMRFGTSTTPPADPCSCEDPRIITTHFPTGFIGNPHAIPRCTLAQFGTQACPPSSQVGAAQVLGTFQVPVYNMEPHPDQAGMVAFTIPLVNGSAFIDLSARSDSDYGLDASSEPIFHLLPMSQLDLYLWGVPSSPVNDVHRWPRPNPLICSNFAVYPAPCFAPVAADVPPIPYLQNPTSCGEPLSIGLEVQYYNGTTVSADAPWPETTGCDQLSFNPSLTAKPTTTQADTASGLDVNLSVPQPLSPTLPSPSELKATTVTLPEGFSINPNVADGKTACTDEQAAFGTKAAANCPETSKIGTDLLDSSALPAPISGGIYLGEPKPGDKYRIFLTADGFATHVKLAGSAKPDPQTGRLVVTFPDLPQSPFQGFDMHFFGSERGLLATPEQCGTYTVDTEFVPWDSLLASQHSLSFFTVDSGPNGRPCPEQERPFDPDLEAGTVDSTAGAHTPFVLNLTRQDGDQNLTALNVTTPPGFTAKLAGIPYCPESALSELSDPTRSGLAEQTVPACLAASQIGTATTGEGAGTHPLYTPGKVYLAGPYKGAPLSLVIVVPAVSGPYDLGNVAVRSAVFVDPTTAQISTVSDPIPQILEGIPLRLRSVLINLDRPNFALNPTNCDRHSVDAEASGDQGAVADLSAHFQVANCLVLGFSPKLGFKFTGGNKRNGHPSLHATVKANAGDANIARVAVTLPRSEQLDQENLAAPCTRAQFAADACPPETIQGQASATTPLLDEPVSGPVYLVTSNHRLPDLVAALHGQIDVDLRGRIDTQKDGRIRSTFDTVPDVPVTSFRLDMIGGKRGLLVNNRSLCTRSFRVQTNVTGQNGRRADQAPKLRVACGKARKRHRHNRHKRLARARKVG